MFLLPQKKISPLKKTGIILISCILAFIVWLLYVINGLRIFIPYYPAISGFPFQTKNYLVVFQNEAELRPGGGFMTAYGILKFSHGMPTSFEVHDIFSVSDKEQEYIEPPYPLKEFLGNEFYKGWAFQDSNWYADFEENAKKMMWFYQQKFPQETIDGVMALNFNVTEELLKLLGTIQTDDKTFSSSNLFSQLEYEVSNIDRHNVDDLKKRKDILKQLYEGMLQKTILSPIKYKMLAALLDQKLNEKEIQLYFTNPTLQNLIEKKEWSGRILPEEKNSDFLGVLEANLAGMKSDRYITRSIDYTVQIEKNVPAKATVTITFTHAGDYNEPLSYTYQGYIRILVPKGSVVVQKEKDTVVEQESGFTVLGKKLVLEPGKQKTLTFQYLLPAEITKDNHYSLHVNKQSGTNDMYHITIHTPSDFIVQGENWNVKDNVALYSNLLQKDVDLSLALIPDAIPPRVTFQIFKDIKTIELHFNENIDTNECEKKENYAITDNNINNPKTDTIDLMEVTCDGKGALLRVKGITKQPEEQYKIVIKNLKDLYGNTIEPNPKTITVVQRGV